MPRYDRREKKGERAKGNQGALAQRNPRSSVQKSGWYPGVRYGEPMRLYEESLAINRRLGNEAVIASTLHNIGIIHDKQGRHSEAMRVFCQALAINRRIGVPTKGNEKSIAIVKRRVPGRGC